MMRFKFSPLLLGVLLWVLCTHSKSFASILISTPYTPPYHSSLERTLRDALNDPGSQAILTTFKKARNASVVFADGVIMRMDRLETSLGWSGIHVEKETPAHGQLIINAADVEGFGQVRPALVAGKAGQQLLNANCRSISSDQIQCAKYLTQLSMESTPLEKFCKVLKPRCGTQDYFSKYRSVDGSCNHMNESWGRAFTGYRRLVFPKYSDGVAEPRKSSDHKELPSARVVSVKLIKDMSKEDETLTLAVMQWGQFVTHDMAHTASSRMLYKSDSVMCCDSNGNTLLPRYIHPFCMPVEVPEDDKFYSQHRVTCMSYVRSLPALNTDCLFGPVDQMNQMTHYLDASHIYGSTTKRANHLRQFKSGRLVVSENAGRHFLPLTENPKEDCQVLSSNSECFKSGDVRVNMQPHLTAMHILWLREHNRISSELARINPHWDDEKLYQETRRIIIAEIQHITYSEWVPLILGDKYNKKFFSNEFHENIDPRVSNSFASAAMKFTNSLVDSYLKIFDEKRNQTTVLRLHENYNKPEAVEKPGNLDGLIRGLATQSCQKLDLDVVSDVTEKLYSTGKLGFDALSLDIQRGRDHGLPGYTDYRDFCGLSSAKKFSDLQDFIAKETVDTLQSVYSNPKDIDLLVGGLAEKQFGDSLLGPTFTCIIADQLYRTRLGDRYFYTNIKKPWSFTSEQLREIKRVTLASIFCENGDDMKTMQKNVFKTISDSNKLMECGEIPKMDLSKWREVSK